MRKLWAWIEELPTWVFVGLFIISGLITAQALRHNNQQMIQLRTELYSADQSGQNVDKALTSLSSYVYGHMNTNLASGGNTIKPPIQLKYTYERAVKAEQSRVDKANEKIALAAQDYCLRVESGRYRQICFQQYTDKHNVKAKAIPSQLYEFDFLSPSWSPDFAGWGLVATLLLAIVAMLSFGADKWAAIRHGRRLSKI